VSQILAVLTQNIVPIFTVAGFGVIASRWLRLDKQVLSRVTLYILSPCLVFSSLIKSELNGADLFRLLMFVLIAAAITALVAWVMGKALSLGQKELSALLLAAVFANNGNYGMTINQLRYGDPGLARAAIYFTITTALVYTVGIFIASAGVADWRYSARRLLGMPAFYAVALALIFYAFSFSLPAPLLRGIEITGQGAIPVMLLVLGMQIADLREMPALRVAVPAAGVRLLVGPAIGVIVATILGVSGLNRSVTILQTAMPTAVVTTILATEFDTEPQAVTSAVVLSTLLSPVTVAVAIGLLNL